MANVSFDQQDVTGWGFNVSGATGVTPRDTAYFEITFGEGIGGFRGIPDAGPDSLGVLEPLPAFAWNVAWTHDWSENWSSNFIVSKGEVTNSAGQAGSELRSLQYLAANIIWSPNKHVDVGLEYLFRNYPVAEFVYQDRQTQEAASSLNRNSGVPAMKVLIERPMKGFATLLFLVLSLTAGHASTVRGGQESAADDSKPSRTNSIYAKIVLPMKEPADGEQPLVESWIARKLRKRGKTEFGQ